MQGRMLAHQLTQDQINALLAEAQVGHLATLNDNGFPYVTPVHFVAIDGAIYIHGLCKGQKLENIQRENKVCFEVERLEKFLLDAIPCDVNTQYQSVIILGEASLVSDDAQKINVLKAIVAKYVPSLVGTPFPPNMLAGTTVIKITINACTGKFYDETC